MFQRVLLDFVLKTFGLGAENETRTRDPNLGKVVLYHLSYFRIFKNFCSTYFGFASANIRQKKLLCKKKLKKTLFYFKNLIYQLAKSIKYRQSSKDNYYFILTN